MLATEAMSIYNIMTKKNMRSLMIHFNQLYQHYRSTPDVLVPTDKITVKLLKPGSTLVWNSYGYRFVNHIQDLHIYDDFQKSNISLDRTFDNIVIVNPMVLRYTTTTELSERLLHLITKINEGGRLQLSFNSQFLLWNRVSSPIGPEIELLVNKLEQQGLQLIFKDVKLLQTTITGDCKFLFDKSKQLDIHKEL